jgi:hypothetical protein
MLKTIPEFSSYLVSKQRMLPFNFTNCKLVRKLRGAIFVNMHVVAD